MLLSIGQVSKLFGISSDTLRYYDKIGILKPTINSENNYRYYNLHDLENLTIILDIKSLGVALNKIKNSLESENLNSYRDLLKEQEILIDKKLEKLLILKTHLSNSSKTLDLIADFKNQYNLENLKSTIKSYTLLGLKTSDLLRLCNSVTLQNIARLDYSSYFYLFKINNNIIIEDEENIFLEESDFFNIFKDENFELHKLINSKISFQFISIDFYGNTSEIHNYIILLNKHFKFPSNNQSYLKFNFYLPKKNNKSKYLVNINIKFK